MLSEESLQKLHELEAGQRTYTPNRDVAAKLREKTLIMLVGPTCVGKTTVMQEVLRLDDRFAITGTFTTREKRDDDQLKNYTYIPHTDKGIAEIYQKIKDGEAVQYALHPTSGRVYGSDISDYPKAYNMLDTLSTAVTAIEALPARDAIVIGVAVRPQQWLEWFDSRFPPGHPDREKRRDEAVQSLSWLLERPVDSVHWIINAPGELEEAAKQVIAIATHQLTGDESGRSVAQTMLAAAKDLRA